MTQAPNMAQYDAIKAILDQDPLVAKLNAKYDMERFEDDENYELAYYNELSALYRLILADLFGDKTNAH